MRRSLHVLAALLFGTFLVQAAYSWVLAPAATYSARPHGQLTFYGHIGDRVARAAADHAPDLLLAVTQSGPRAGAASGGVTADRAWHIRRAEREVAAALGGDLVAPDWFMDAYAWPLVVATFLAGLALLVLARSRTEPDEATVALVRRWGVAYVVAMAWAMPVLVPDFWLSFAWGRTLWWGGNPYYDVPAAAVVGLPFDAPILRMTYGPLWALISWGVTAVTHGSVLGSAVVFKAILVAAWSGILWLVSALLADRPARLRAMALVTVAWMPLGAVQIGGDGHNDAVMVFFLLAWLFLRSRGHARWATAALACSVSVKYVTAPLFLLDAWPERAWPWAWRDLLARARTYLPNAAIAVAIWLVTFAPFVDSLSFFRETTAVREGYFFLPADGVKAIGTLAGLNLLPLAYAVQVIFPVATIITLWHFLRTPDIATFQVAVAGIMLSVLFIAAAHVWPWYVLWLLLPAMLLPSRHLLRRWATGVWVTAPFPLMVWTAWPHAGEFQRFEVPSLVAYAAALAWMLLGWRAVEPRVTA
ncbi:MAG: hypothetical protein IPK85_11905 [Gemmatimonadetes bacterium]|nr:hypothetical protein [Gemmatimonadota bacterium]